MRDGGWARGMDHRTVKGPSDERLIDGCLRGSERSWAQLVGRYERMVFSIARSEGLDRTDAEDLVQQVFLQLVSSLESLRETTKLPGWLATVTRRQAWRKRDAKRRLEPSDPSDDDLDLPDEEDPVGRSADLITLVAALEELGGRCDCLLRRLYLSDADPSYEVVAAELDIPVGSIGPTRARCLEKLRTILERDPHYDSVTFRDGRISLLVERH